MSSSSSSKAPTPNACPDIFKLRPDLTLCLEALDAAFGGISKRLKSPAPEDRLPRTEDLSSPL